MTTWQPLEVPEPVGTAPVAARTSEAPPRTVLLVRTVDGRLHATVPACPHLGQPLTDATVSDGVLECSHHAYRYRLTDGVCVGPDSPLAGRLDVFDVRERPDGSVVVRLLDATGDDAP